MHGKPVINASQFPSVINITTQSIKEDIYVIKHIINLPFNSIKLKTRTDTPITNPCPASIPLIPATIFMAFVANTANMPIYK